MVAIGTITSQLADLQKGPATRFVAVLVGATSGIGESTAREITQYIPRPTIYLVGRAQAEADRIKAELQELNTKSQVHFIQGDVSLLNQVDRICDEIKSKEDKINLLCLTAGIMTSRGRDETTEGLDRKLSLHYYSRMRFTENLLPVLRAARDSKDTSEEFTTARVISALGAGYEGGLNMSDLSLKTSYSLRTAANHAISMNSLYFDGLAKENPSITFVHTSPGMIDTNLKRNMGTFMQYAFSAGMLLLKPFATSLKECGERNAWTATCHHLDQGGAQYLNQVNDYSRNTKYIEKCRSDGITTKVMEHTREIFSSYKNSIGNPNKIAIPVPLEATMYKISI